MLAADGLIMGVIWMAIHHSATSFLLESLKRLPADDVAKLLVRIYNHTPMPFHTLEDWN